MKIWKYGLLLVFIVAISCVESNTVKSHYVSGSLLSEIEYDEEGLRNGLAKEYFENGNIMKIAKYKDDELIDTTHVFYENGNKKSTIIFVGDSVYSTGFYEKGTLKGKGRLDKRSKVKLGWWEYFDEQGNLENKVEYVERKGESYPNQFIVYSNELKIIEDQSFYYSIDSPETALINMDSLVTIRYNSPFQDKSHVYIVIEKNDKGVVLKDSIEMLYNPTQVNLRFDKLGIKKIKGYFLEYYEDRFDKPNVDSTSVKERKMYFDKEIEVLDN